MRFEPAARFRHFKGGLCSVYGLAKHTESGEVLVLYRHNGADWARPLSMFLEKVKVGEQEVDRFHYEAPSSLDDSFSLLEAAQAAKEDKAYISPHYCGICNTMLVELFCESCEGTGLDSAYTKEEMECQECEGTGKTFFCPNSEDPTKHDIPF